VVSGEPYASLIVGQIPRLLGLIDRQPGSPTAGCCDRTYWSWKFVDFPRSRFQEAACVLGFLWATPLPGNRLHHNPKALEWLGEVLRFWGSIQHADGSFDEAYPYERALSATSFTSFYVGESLGFAGEALPDSVDAAATETLRRAGDWLCRNDEHHGFLSNHLAAAAAGLWHAFRATGEERFRDRSRYFIDKILARQSEEGWYDEYGGADPGYQTHGSFYLARLWQLGAGDDLLDSLGRATTFLAHFVHPDGSLGGEYTSRNTQTYYPAAFEMLAGEHGAASWIAGRQRPVVGGAAAAGLPGIDQFNYFPLLNNLVFAWQASTDAERGTATPEEPDPGPGLTWYPRAGLARIRRERYDLYVGPTKGGVVKLFDREAGRLVYNDCGYLGRLAGGKTFSTQQQDGSEASRVEEGRIEIEGSFFEISRPTMKPWRFAAFRLFSLTVGRMPAMARWLKNLLVKVLIYRRRALNIRFERTIEAGESEVTVTDRIKGDAGGRIESLRWTPSFTTIHMGSSRYFVDHETEPDPAVPDAEIPPAEIPDGVERTRTIKLEPSCR
jgi:hypothetical protein